MYQHVSVPATSWASSWPLLMNMMAYSPGIEYKACIYSLYIFTSQCF